MGRISFSQEAAEMRFDQMRYAPGGAQFNTAAFNDSASQALNTDIAAQPLTAAGLTVKCHGDTQTVKVRGVALDQATQEKIVVPCGNVCGVANAEDQLAVATPTGPESKLRDVKQGDTLLKIARKEYGGVNSCVKILEGNKLMQSNPENIFPGQILWIPTACARR